MIPNSNLLKTLRLCACACIAVALTTAAHAILDTNTNGLSDVWEKQHNTNQLFSNTNPDHTPTADPDQDDWTNAQEAVAGTNPFDGSLPNGKTTLTIQAAPQAATYELTWSIIPGKNYRVQASTNLHFWVNVGPIIHAEANQNTHTLDIQATDPDDPNATAPPPRLFYRVKVTDDDEDGDDLTTAEEFALGLNQLSASTLTGIADHWFATHFIDQLLTLGLTAVIANTDPDGDGQSNQQEQADGTNPNAADTDGDGLKDGEDAVSKDAEINWKKSPETLYVWLDQVDEIAANHQAIAVNKDAQILFRDGRLHLLYINDNKNLWNSATKEWITLPLNGSQEIDLGILGTTMSFDYHGVTSTYNQQTGKINLIEPVTEFIDINDSGTVCGWSKGENYIKADPLIPGMVWKRTGASATTYSPPSYFFPLYPFSGNGGVSIVQNNAFIYPTQAHRMFGAIAHDGTINAACSYTPAGDEWMTYDSTANTASMQSIKSLNANNTAWNAFPGGILDKNRALFVEAPLPPAVSSKIWLKESSGVSDLSFMTDQVVELAEMSELPPCESGKSPRLWISTGPKCHIEKRNGGSGSARWHSPTSMAEGAIRLNAQGIAITAGDPGTTSSLPPKVWRNGKYHDLNGLINKPENSTLQITQAIDLATNGIILVQATEGSVKKTGILVPVELKEVSFSEDEDNYWELKSDDASKTYSAPQWKNMDGDSNAENSTQGEHNNAVAYTRNTRPKIGAKFKIANAASLGAIKIKFKGPDGIEITETVASVSGDNVILPETAATAFPDKVKFYDKKNADKAFQLQWELKIGDADWVKVATSKHTIYVTLAKPLSLLRQETLFEIGCRRAHDKSDTAQTRTAAYAEFEAKQVKRLDDGMQMSYWKSGQPGGSKTSEILASADGNGNCNAWASFFRDVLRLQGIEANMVQVRPIIPETPDNEKVLAVKEWIFTGSGSAPAPYPFLIGIDATPGNAGTLAQNNQNPPKRFDVHFVTLSDGIIYDPSYGTTAIGTSVKDYEDATFAGFGRYIDQQQGVKKIAFKKNDKSENSEAEIEINAVNGE